MEKAFLIYNSQNLGREKNLSDLMTYKLKLPV